MRSKVWGRKPGHLNLRLSLSVTTRGTCSDRHLWAAESEGHSFSSALQEHSAPPSLRLLWRPPPCVSGLCKTLLHQLRQAPVTLSLLPSLCWGLWGSPCPLHVRRLCALGVSHRLPPMCICQSCWKVTLNTWSRPPAGGAVDSWPADCVKKNLSLSTLYPQLCTSYSPRALIVGRITSLHKWGSYLFPFVNLSNIYFHENQEFQSLSVQIAGSCAVMSEAMSPKVSGEPCAVGKSVKCISLCSDVYLFTIITVLLIVHM